MTATAPAIQTKNVPDREPPDFGMQIFDLSIGRAALLTAREHIGNPVDSLLLPCSNLVWVKLVLRRHLLHGFVAKQGFQSQLGFKVICKILAFRHSRIPSKVWDTPELPVQFSGTASAHLWVWIFI